MTKAPPCPERSMKTQLPQQRSSATVRRKRRDEYEERAKRMLGYQEDSSELKEPPEMPEKHAFHHANCP